jgi:hypothetical protein
MPPAKPDLIGSAEACDLLEIDRATLVRRIAAGKLDYWVKLPGANGAYLFDRKAIAAIADETRNGIAS